MKPLWIPSRNILTPPRKLIRGAWNIDMRPQVDVEAPEEFFFDDHFETGNKSKTMNGVAWYANGTNCSVVDFPSNPFGGGKAMRFRDALKDGNGESWCEQRMFLGSASAQGIYTDVSVRYDMVIPFNYTHINGPGSDNNKFWRIWSGDENDGNQGYQDYYIKGGCSVNSSTSSTNLGRLMTEWGSDAFAGNPAQSQGVGQNGTPNVNNFILDTDQGQLVSFIIRLKTDTLAPINSVMSTTGGNGALQVWKNGVPFASFTELTWRSRFGIGEYFRFAYVLGYRNQGPEAEMLWYLCRIRLALGPTGPQQLGIAA